MSKFLLWYLVALATGSPLAALVVLLVFWWAVDRFTVQVLPNPLRAFGKWRRAARLRETLAMNPHDRRARHELAELLVERRRYAAAVDVLKPNVAAGDQDPATLYVMGVACLGAQHYDQGEVFLGTARDDDPNFRMGAIDLELGRWRLERDDAKGALEPLERFCRARAGTVEGKVLLARALAATGEAERAKRMRDAAWDDFVTLPRFQRRRERLWAWRARPQRPLAYAGIAIACGLAFSWLAGPAIRDALENPPAYEEEHDHYRGGYVGE